jgi:hypothetical protein
MKTKLEQDQSYLEQLILGAASACIAGMVYLLTFGM